MISPSPQCSPHEVTHTYQTWTTDADGGRIAGETVVRRGYPCAVQPLDTEEILETTPEGGTRRVTVITRYQILYPENPRLNIDDIVTWTDEDDNTHTIVVKGYRSGAGVGSVWKLKGEERT